MTMQYKKLFEPLLVTAITSGTAQTVLTVPSDPASTLFKGGVVRLTNTSGAAASVTLFAVPLAGTNSATNNFFPTKSIPNSDFVDVQVPQLKAGDFVQVFAGTASAINVQPLAGAFYSA